MVLRGGIIIGQTWWRPWSEIWEHFATERYLKYCLVRFYNCGKYSTFQLIGWPSPPQRRSKPGKLPESVVGELRAVGEGELSKLRATHGDCLHANVCKFEFSQTFFGTWIYRCPMGLLAVPSGYPNPTRYPVFLSIPDPTRFNFRNDRVAGNPKHRVLPDISGKPEVSGTARYFGYHP